MLRFTLAILQILFSFHVTFIKIINVVKNNKRVYYFFVNVTNALLHLMDLTRMSLAVVQIIVRNTA